MSYSVTYQKLLSDFDIAKFGRVQNFIRVLIDYCRMSFVCKRLLSDIDLFLSVLILFVSDTEVNETAHRSG
jgi:hypothetical protein